MASTIQKMCATCGQYRPFTKETPNYAVHILITFLTCGFWIVPLFVMVVMNSMDAPRCTFCGSTPSMRGNIVVGGLCLVLMIFGVMYGFSRMTPAQLVSTEPAARVEKIDPVKSTAPANMEPVTPGASTPPPAAAVQAAQTAAMKRHPELAHQGSDFNVAFVTLFRRLQKEHSDRLNDPEWPIKLADEVASGHP